MNLSHCFLLSVFVSACATTQPTALSNANQDRFFSTSTDNGDFDAFLVAIRKDEIVASSVGKKYHQVDESLNFAVLLTGLFAGYTSTFTGSVDLPEAGFAAASVLGLSNFLNAPKNRDASRQAARRLDCVVREAQPFRGDFYMTSPVISQSLQAVTITRGGRSTTSNVLTPQWIRSPSFSPADAADEPRVAILKAKIVTKVSNEQMIYNDRFSLVIDAYRKVLRNWEAASNQEYQKYDDILEQFKQAVEQSEQQENTQQEVQTEAENVRGLLRNPGDVQQVANLDIRYSEAKEALIKCAGLD